MYYKVVVKEMKKTTVACDACKKRKGKCTGTSPCTRCAEAGIPCTYLQGNKKRGPVSKKQKTAQFNDTSCVVDGTSPLFYLGNDKLVANNREAAARIQQVEAGNGIGTMARGGVQITEEGENGEKTVVEYNRRNDGFSRSTLFSAREASRNIGLALASAYYETTLSNSMERNYLVELFMENMTFSDTLDEIESLRQKLLTPKTHAQEMKVRSVMAFMARGLGQMARAEQFVSDARNLATPTLEDPSFDAAEAFYSLSSYYPLTDYRNAMFLNMSFGITKWIAANSEEARRFHNFSLIATTVLDKSMDAATKRKILKVHAPGILSTGNKPTLKDLLLAAVVKFYCVLSPVLLDRLHLKRMHELKDIRFSPEEAAQMLDDASFLEQLIRQHSPQKGIIFVLKVTKLLILWRSGDIEGALKEADSAIDWDDFEPYKYLSWSTTLISEVPHNFWALSLFYAQIGQFEKSRKVYGIFTTISKLYGHSDTDYLPPCPAPLPHQQLALPTTAPTTTTTTTTTTTAHHNIKKEEPEAGNDMFDVPRLLNMYSNTTTLHYGNASHEFGAPGGGVSEIINIPYVGTTGATPQQQLSPPIQRATSTSPPPLSPATPVYHTPPQQQQPNNQHYNNSTYLPPTPPTGYNSPYMPNTPQQYNNSSSPPTPPTMYNNTSSSNSPTIRPPFNMYTPTTTFLSHDMATTAATTVLSTAPPPTISNFYTGLLRDDVEGNMYTLLEDWLMK